MNIELTNVLLVEDELAHVDAIRRAMEAHGPQLRVQSVGSLGEFSTLVASTPPDIAVMDLNLPDGRAESMLAYPPEMGAFPILVMTSHGDQETAAAAIRAGAMDYVVKSADSFAALPRIVERTLREWKLLTERKQRESQQKMTIEILRILNQSGNLTDVIDSVMLTIQRGLDLHAVGVRLRRGSDFPYFRVSGFPKSFVLAENSLCARETNGSLCRDETENPILECACGMVLSGKTDPMIPLCTPGGSFWTEDAPPVLQLARDQDPRANPRNRCFEEGYRSVALVPVRAQEEILGLLQLNDHRPGRFTPELVGLLEGLGHSLGSDLARRQDAERLRMALDAAQEGLWDWDLETDSGHASPRFNLLLGYAPGELAYSHRVWQGLVHPEDLPGTQHDLEDFLQRQEGVWSREYRLRRKAGDYIWVLSNAKIVEQSADGQVLRMAGTIVDISERRDIQEQLLQAQKMESVGRLAGGVAHDFNNLLTVINGYSELLLKRLPSPDPSRPHLDEIHKAGERAASLTQQLLAFSRRQVMQPRTLDLNALVLEAQKLIERIIGEDIELSTELEPALGRVTADPGQLNQVLMNLAVNARDAMPDGGRLVIETTNVDFDESAIQTHREAHPGHYVELAVSDTGVGMDEETKKRLFEPFFTTKPLGAGTGLGLATVYGIVRQSGGWIAVSSELGEGSTFTIYLPRVASPVDVVIKVSESSVPKTGTETVLVVEDQQGVRDLVCSVLRKYNYRVLEATGGEEALRIANSYAGPIHLMVTDVVMSRMSGHDLAVELKAQRPESLVLYISGYPDEVLGQHGVLDAEVSFLQKPFSPEALAGRVRQLLDEARLRPLLVVDDDESVRSFLMQVLQEAGYAVKDAKNGLEALAVLKTCKFSAVITDLVMPEKEGMDIIAEIRKSYPTIRVIAISGAFGGKFLKPARLIGAHAALAKPLNPETLLSAVRSLVGAAR